jgi:hypothetical protein
MQWVWLIPSLGYGVYIFATTGQTYGLVFGAFSLVATAGNSIFQNRREPVDLKAPVHFGAGRFAIGNRVLPRWEWLWRGSWVTRVYEAIVERNQANLSALALRQRLQGSLSAGTPDGAGLRAWLGFAGSSEVQLDLAEEGAHAIIVGATGSGKSQLLVAWLVSLCQGYAPKELKLYLVDYKGGAALSGFAQTPWAAGLLTDLTGGVGELLATMLAELEWRERLLAGRGAGRIEELAPDPPPRLLLAIDEVQAVLAEPGSQQILEALAARGRSLGIHVVMTGQSLAGIPRALLTNLGCRIAVGKCDPIDLAQLGYSRALGGEVGARPEPVESLGREWGAATLISPRRQLLFAFPSRGAVGAERLREPVQQIGKIDFLAGGSPYAHQNAPFATEFVAKPERTFDFSIGL